MKDGIGTASWLELFFILVGLVAFFYNLRNYRFFAGILREVIRLRKNGFFLLQARKDRRHEAERLTLQALFLLAGLVGALTPAPANPKVTMGQAISSAIIVGLQIGMAISSYKDARDNEKQNKYVSTPTSEWDGSERREQL